MQKNCPFCGNLCTKKGRKYCSKECVNKSKIGNTNGFVKGKPAWNKGVKGSVKPNSGTFKKGDKRLIGNKVNKGRTPWNKGVTPSEETRKKISKTLTGRPTGRTGEKCNFWKGGKSKEYTKLKNSLDWKNWRRAVFERDNYTCQMCLVRGGNLQPHHIKERCNYPELQFEISNGQTLCRDCHKTTDSWGNKYLSLN